ncbi:MAG: iron-sulfur cluster assembly scaffold protein [Deltaproteobacteria bacterium]|nr:iron-sulfur cluster assembly scaffold protein [Deltaproteobacteria bacterium]
MKKLDIFVNDLQEQIFDEAREAYGEKGFERWRNPRFNGKMKDHDAHAKVTGACGDTMEIFLKFENNRVKDASYFTDGCASSSICGSFAAELAIEKKTDELTEITGETVIKTIGGLPKEERHCAFLAAETIQEALSNYMTDLTKTEYEK